MRTNRLWVIAAVWLGAIVVPVASRAAVYVVPPDAVMVGKAAVIVRGRVAGIVPVDDGAGIHTDITIVVTRVLKGTGVPASILVRQPGGHTSDRDEIYPGIGRYAQGEDVLLMLDKGAGAYRVTDFALGRFKAMHTATGAVFFRRDGLADAFVLGSPQGASDDPDRDAAAFERFVAAIAAGTRATADYALPRQQATPEEADAGFTFISPVARWTEFDSLTPVVWHDNASGDPGTLCGADHCHDETAAGVIAWNATPDTHIFMSYGGTSPDVGAKCFAQLSNEVQYDDPCHEITDLTACSGTLALSAFTNSTESGGSPPCPAKGGPSFLRIVSGRILINNGTGSCLTSCDYTSLIAHSMGHALGAGHSLDNTALMSPFLVHGICGVPQSDDVAFAQCAYPLCACNDRSDCTTDTCTIDGSCVFTPRTGACDDHDACTLDEACLDGVCTPASSLLCDDGNPCTRDACDPAFGTCTFTEISGPCDDGDACTTGDVCDEGLCRPTGTIDPKADCNDHNLCTRDICTPDTGCLHVPEPCHDGDPRTIDSCDPVRGCVYTRRARYRRGGARAGAPPGVDVAR